MNDASRPVRASEAEACAAHGIEFIELPVAFDALSVVVNPRNDFVSCLTTADLKRIWEPEAQGRVTHWNDVREEWPDETIRLYGPGTDSGTFDYFTEVINGREDASRADFNASEDDNVLVQGVAGDKGALGYFGFAYYAENSSRLKLVAIDSGSGCVTPSREAVEKGSYSPLSRPLFIYVAKAALERPEVMAFVEYYLENVAALAADTGYVSLPAKTLSLVRQRFDNGTTGTMYTPDSGGLTLDQLLERR
jgi:phosphate transport system substrate-binding protein